MKKPKIIMQVIKEETGYSANGHVHDIAIFTDGETFQELKANILEAVNLAFEESDFVYAIEEIKFEMDVPSFFYFYKVVNAKALSERIGMNQSLLAQYIKGNKKPSANQTKRILDGVQKLGRELAEVDFFL